MRIQHLLSKTQFVNRAAQPTLRHAKNSRLVVCFGLMLLVGCSASSAVSPDDTTREPLGEASGGANSSTPQDDATTGEDSPAQACSAATVDGRLIHGEASPLVLIDPTCGRLSYGRYANQGQDNADHILPDFSFAGYMQGGVALPDLPVKVTLAPQAGDNRAAIQAAIDEVSALTPDASGFRGAVLLQAGTYEVSDTLLISTSGVVLRGEGQGPDGTVLIATRTEQHDLLQIAGGGSGLGEVSDTLVNIRSDIVPVGANSFAVEDASTFSVGDTVGVRRTPNQSWIDELEMGQFGWTAEAYAIDHERKIVAIDGNVITVDIPIVDTMEAHYGGGQVFLADVSGRISQCGVEDLRLDSIYQTADDENHGWNAVTLSYAQDSFIRRVTAVHFGYAAVNIVNNSSFNTAEEVALLEPISQVIGGRRYSFNVASGGVGNLFQRCYAEQARHSFVTASRVPGPNVWLDCISVESTNDEGPHHRWSTGLLLDNTWGAEFNAQNRADGGSGHGWAGAQTMFWNIFSDGFIVSDAPLGAMNWSVGAIGEKAESTITPEAPDGIWESLGTHVQPRSLYLAQLEDRLGSEAVVAVTTSEQRAGVIHEQLNGWAGGGLLRDATPAAPMTCEGILIGKSCCPAACGQCGGSGCGSAPGGSASCCSSIVEASGLSCATNAPPCVME